MHSYAAYSMTQSTHWKLSIGESFVHLYTQRTKSGEQVFFSGVDILYNYFPVYFLYPVCPGVHLLQIEIEYCKYINNTQIQKSYCLTFH